MTVYLTIGIALAACYVFWILREIRNAPDMPEKTYNNKVFRRKTPDKTKERTIENGNEEDSEEDD